MSTLWTPSGEHRPNPDSEPGGGDDIDLSARGGGYGDGDPPGPDPGDVEPTPEEIAALRELHARLTATPVVDVIANHALGIWQLALVHLGVVTPPDSDGRRPAPNLAAAGLAIDALAAIVDGLGPRLGEHEQVLRDALVQAQMLFVEVADAVSEQEPGR